MSWDLYVVPREHVDDPHDWIESLVDTPGDAATARDHAGVVRARRPELEASGPDEHEIVELSSPEASGRPFQILLDGRHAEIGVAYWDIGDRTDELADLVDVVSALTEHTGWVVFDPQEDRGVTIDELRGAFLAGHETGVGWVREIVAETTAPRRRRFFGLFG